MDAHCLWSCHWVALKKACLCLLHPFLPVFMSQPSSWLITMENVERGTTGRVDLLHTEHSGQDPAYGYQKLIKSNSILGARLSWWFHLQCRAGKEQAQIKISVCNILKVDIDFKTEITWEQRCGLALQAQNWRNSISALKPYYISSI